MLLLHIKHYKYTWHALPIQKLSSRVSTSYLSDRCMPNGEKTGQLITS